MTLQGSCKIFMILFSSALVFLGTACGGSNDKGAGLGSAPQATVISGDKLDTHAYHNVRGKIFGAWEAKKDERNSAGEDVHMDIQFYFKLDATAVRLICSKKGVNYADMAGVMASRVQNDVIAFRQSLNLQYQDCALQVPLKTVGFQLNTEGNVDLLAIDPANSDFQLTRQTPLIL